jgi:hypothetical protein
MYNLLDEKWVSVIYRTGKPDDISLLELLRDADKLQLAYSNPMDRFAVFRFILALGYWCFANTGTAPIPGKPLSGEWIGWLEENRQYFELFGEGQRFYQGAPTPRIRPSTDLIHELPTANNLNHFNHVTDYVDGLCQPCCIKGLLRLPVFTTIGGSGIGAGINNTPPFYAAWLDDSLAAMLCRNWEPREKLGTPAWLGSYPLNDGIELGLLTGMTFLPRKVHLHDPVPGKKACCLCGAKPGALVYSCSIEPEPVPNGIKREDPHAVITYDAKNDKRSLASRIKVMSNDKYTFADRDWYSPLLHYFQDNGAVRNGKLWLVGFASDKAKRVDIWDKTIDFPGGEYPQETLTQLENRQYSLNTFRKKPRRGDYRKSVGVTQIADLIPHIESGIAAHAGEMVGSRSYGVSNADAEYSAVMPAIAQSLEPEPTVSARLKRDEFLKRKPWPAVPKGKKKIKGDGQNE